MDPMQFSALVVAAVVLRVASLAAQHGISGGLIANPLVFRVSTPPERVNVSLSLRHIQRQNLLGRLFVVESDIPLERIALVVEIALPPRFTNDFCMPEDTAGVCSHILKFLQS